MIRVQIESKVNTLLESFSNKLESLNVFTYESFRQLKTKFEVLKINFKDIKDREEINEVKIKEVEDNFIKDNLNLL